MVEHLLSGARHTVHVCRIKPYADSEIGPSVKMAELAERADRIYQSVRGFSDLRKTAEGQIEIQTQWKGLQDVSSTWEPLVIMAEDVPATVRQYFDSRTATKLVREAQSLFQDTVGDAVVSAATSRRPTSADL